jgi:neutral ceramidase
MCKCHILHVMIKKIFIIIACIIGVVLLFLAASVLPIDRYDYHTESFYRTMTSRLDSLKEVSVNHNAANFSIGYAKVNLTPPQRTATAGYGNRKGQLYTSVHDSIFVRAMVISNGSTKVAIVSADLLIIPPTVTSVLQKKLPDGFSLNNTFLGAIHSHNSIGSWGEGVAGFLYGSYNDSIVQFIATKINESIVKASRNLLPSTLKTAHLPLRSPVKNRLIKGGRVDSLLHVVEVKRTDSSKLILMNYTAHATCLFSRDLELSRDYPGKVVDELEQNGYAFAMFMAGAVGSHGSNPPEAGWSCIDWMGDTIVSTFEAEKEKLVTLRDTTLLMYRIPLALGKPQVKISKDWCVRPWLFKAAFGESPNYLTVLRIGELVMIGTPCDFSGELTPALYSTANQNGLQLMVSSFNGGYIGYITPVAYYDNPHYETRLMNWYGPGSGEYMVECMEKMIQSVSK